MKRFYALLVILFVSVTFLQAQTDEPYWIKTMFPDISVKSISCTQGYVFALSNDGKLYRLHHNGQIRDLYNEIECKEIKLDNDSIVISAVIALYDGVFVGTKANGVYLSLNNGDTFVQINNGLVLEEILFFKNYYAVTKSNIFKFNKIKQNWTKISPDIGDNEILALEWGKYDTLLLAIKNKGILKSDSYNYNWILASDSTIIQNTNLIIFNFRTDSIYACSDNSVFVSKNFGQTWSKVLDKNDIGTITAVYSFERILLSQIRTIYFIWHPFNIFLGIKDGGLNLVFDEDFSNRTKIDSGLVDKTLTCFDSYITSPGYYIYAGTSSKGVYRLSNYVPFITSVEDIPNDLGTIKIIQTVNDPIIKIKFDIAAPKRTNISAYDYLGNLVDNIASDCLINSGQTINWNTAHLVSGVYLIRIQLDDRIFTKKVSIMN